MGRMEAEAQLDSMSNNKNMRQWGNGTISPKYEGNNLL